MTEYQPLKPLTPKREPPKPPAAAAGLAERTEKAAQQLEESAIQKVQKARDDLQSALTKGRSQASERIRQVGDVLRKTGKEVSDDNELMAKYVEKASDQIERVASYVSSADLRSLMRDVEALARRRPLLFYGGSLLLGIAAGRVLKGASSSESGETIPALEPGSFDEEDELLIASAPVGSTRITSVSEESFVVPTGVRTP